MTLETPTRATTTADGTRPAAPIADAPAHVKGLRCRACGRPEDARAELRLSRLLRSARDRLRP